MDFRVETELDFSASEILQDLTKLITMSFFILSY